MTMLPTYAITDTTHTFTWDDGTTPGTAGPRSGKAALMGGHARLCRAMGSS